MKRLITATEWISTHQVLTGFLTLVGGVIGLIAAIRSDDPWIRIPGIIFTLAAVFVFIYVVRKEVLSIAEWLTWKFVLGVFIGGLVTGLLYPTVVPFILWASQSAPVIEVTHTEPEHNSILTDATEEIRIFFSEPMLESQRRNNFQVNIEPQYPIEFKWLIPDYGPPESRELVIRPNKYYPNERLQRFEYGKTYKIEVTGLFLKKAVIVEFQTPYLVPDPSEVEPTAIAVEPTAIAVEPTAIAVEPTAIAAEPTAIVVKPTTIAAEPTTTPSLGIGSTMVSEKDGMTLFYVPEGKFLMGSEKNDPDADGNQHPRHTVYLDAFWIDQTEVTNEMFARFVDETGYQTLAEEKGIGWVYDGMRWVQEGEVNWQHPRGPDSNAENFKKHPVVQVTFNDAKGYCAWAGRRLPTEAEWEKAARGTEGQIYPWGDDSPTENLLNFNGNVGETTEVDRYPAGASPYGALDMVGNVWEWTADWYDAKYYEDPPENNPQGPDIGEERVLRGGWWLNETRGVRTAIRGWAEEVGRLGNYGFRCARSP